MTQAHPNAWWMAQLRQAFQEKAVSLSRHEQANGCSGQGSRGSEMGRQDSAICAWALAGLDGLRN